MMRTHDGTIGASSLTAQNATRLETAD